MTLGSAGLSARATVIVGLDAKRRLTVPGDYFDARFDADENGIVFRRVAGRENWLDVLKECPISMDDIPRRSREMAKRGK